MDLCSRGNLYLGISNTVETKNKSRICITGIFKTGLIGVDTHTCKQVDPAQLAQSIGIEKNHSVKAKITLEVVEEPCEFCGKPVTGHEICQKCGKPVCDTCAKKDGEARYCQKCFQQVQSLSKLI